MIIPGISIIKRVSANLLPKADISNKNIGILVVDHAPINISILLNLTPFFINTAAIGNTPYNGPAAAEPNRMASRMLYLLSNNYANGNVFMLYKLWFS